MAETARLQDSGRESINQPDAVLFIRSYSGHAHDLPDQSVTADVDQLLSTKGLNGSLPADIRVCSGRLEYNSFRNYVFYGSLLGTFYDKVPFVLNVFLTFCLIPIGASPNTSFNILFWVKRSCFALPTAVATSPKL